MANFIENQVCVARHGKGVALRLPEGSRPRVKNLSRAHTQEVGSQQALLRARSDFLTISSRYFSQFQTLGEGTPQLRGSSPWSGLELISKDLPFTMLPQLSTKTPGVGAANRKVRLESRSRGKNPSIHVVYYLSLNLKI